MMLRTSTALDFPATPPLSHSGSHTPCHLCGARWNAPPTARLYLPEPHVNANGMRIDFVQVHEACLGERAS